MGDQTKKIPNMTSYGVPCMASVNMQPVVFFIKFQTKDEKEALKLARCVVGSERAANMLCLIDQNDEAWPVK